MKILYSVTIKVDLEIQAEWLEWMTTVHIPDVMATEMFESYKICRLLSQDETDGVTYSVQYICPDMKTLHKYTVQYGPKLQKEHHDKYEGKYVAFRTLLEILD